MFTGYRDVAVVGEGGLGRVYRAVKESTGGVVAIKELPEVPSASPAWHRAQRELQAMLRLKGHPYVVSIEEILEGPNGPCLVMEYLDGGSLSERLAAGPLTFAEAVLVGQHVTQALSAAHTMGIVHRDVKPHNLLIGSFGQVKVADFGIAALTRESGFHTRTQSLTLAYASPEELDGEDTVGPPADVYSFAATMSHLLTGRKPSVRVRSIADDLAALQPVPPAVQPLIAALLRCLAADPAARPTMPDLEGLFLQVSVSLGGASLSRLDREPIRPDTGADDATTVVRRAVPSMAQSPTIAERPPSSEEEAEATVLRSGLAGLQVGSGRRTVKKRRVSNEVAVEAGLPQERGPTTGSADEVPSDSTRGDGATDENAPSDEMARVRRAHAHVVMVVACALFGALALAGLVAVAVTGAMGDPSERDSRSTATAPETTLLPTSAVGIGFPGTELDEFTRIELRQGTGPRAVAGDILVVHYVARRSIDGKEVDVRYESGATLNFVLDTGEVIPAWDSGLLGSSAGGIYRLDVPAGEGSSCITLSCANRLGMFRGNVDISYVVEIIEIRAQ